MTPGTLTMGKNSHMATPVRMRACMLADVTKLLLQRASAWSMPLSTHVRGLLCTPVI